MSVDDFDFLALLGKGSYSCVYKVKRKNDSKIYALKKVYMAGLSQKEQDNALNEVRILASIEHPNIISYKEAFIDEPSDSLCIIMEYADAGDAFQLLEIFKKQGKRFSEQEIWRIFIQTVRGLRELHEMKIMHRDLKSANVFLFTDGLVKLGDLNVSKVMSKG